MGKPVNVNWNEKYLPRINFLIKKYAYEFLNMPNFLQFYEFKDYVYQRFTISSFLPDIDQYSTTPQEDIHLSLMINNNIEYIKSKGYTHVIILPDVFSANPFDIKDLIPVRDTDKKSIVVINNKPWRYIEEYLDPFIWNYDNKAYIFFDESKEKDNDLVINKLSMLAIMKGIGISEDDFEVDEDHNYDLKIDKEDINKIATSNDCLHILIHLPYLSFTPETCVDEGKNPNDFDFGQDMYTLYQQHTHQYKDYKHIYQNRNIILTNTAIGYKADGTWEPLDFTNNKNPYPELFERVDRHTFRIKDFGDFIRIDLFTRPFNYVGWNRVDSIYDELVERNHIYIDLLKGHKKYTTDIITYYAKNRWLTWDQIVDIIERVDFDVYNVIAQEFRMVYSYKVSALKILQYGQKYKNIKKLFGYKFVVPIQIQGEMDTLIFVNGKLVATNPYTIRNGDNVEILLDVDYVTNRLIKRNSYNQYIINDNLEILSKLDDHVSVVLVPRYYRNTFDTDRFKRFAIHSHSSGIINNNLTITAPERAPEESRLTFINGLCTECDFGPKLIPIEPFEIYQSPYTQDNAGFFISNTGISKSPCDISFIHTRKEIIVPKDSNLVKMPDDLFIDYYRTLIFDMDGKLLTPHIDYTILSANYLNILKERFDTTEPEKLLIVKPGYTDFFASAFDNLTISQESFNESYNVRIMNLPEVEDIYKAFPIPQSFKEIESKPLTDSQIDFIKKYTETYIATLNNPFNKTKYTDKLVEYNMADIINPNYKPPSDIPEDSIKVGFYSLNNFYYTNRVAHRFLQKEKGDFHADIEMTPEETFDVPYLIYPEGRIEDHYVLQPAFISGFILDENKW